MPSSAGPAPNPFSIFNPSHAQITNREIAELRSLAKANTPTGVISLKMERPSASIASKAQREGISLRPTNRSPYNRRKSAEKARR
jgi:hypothetical protein